MLLMSMFISRNQVIGLLFIFLGISGLYTGVSGARCLNEKVENPEKPQVLQRKSSSISTDEGFFATINREVPSSPDPLHNSMLSLFNQKPRIKLKNGFSTSFMIEEDENCGPACFKGTGLRTLQKQK
ncbi:hypothetical protein L3X38_035537 [Prunus dulcis]|uniref:Uncharacterized protein n=1 Tax=Prunus dulcis TaxID=3755 RepID=A0AAD4VK43_PRUDU|nr:hypothetical protein L3X38_035537 [Prunus dulcis]